MAAAGLDGTGVDQNFITGADTASGVALDAAHIYWTNSGQFTVGRAGLDGTGVDQNFVDAGSFPVGLAVDAGHLYDRSLGARENTTGVQQCYVRRSRPGRSGEADVQDEVPCSQVEYPAAGPVHDGRQQDDGQDYHDHPEEEHDDAGDGIPGDRSRSSHGHQLPTAARLIRPVF